MLNLVVIPGKTFPVALQGFDPTLFLSSLHQQASELVLAHALSESVDNILEIEEKQQQVLLNHINNQHDKFNKQVDSVSQRQIADTAK
jgi:hypothetical protein